MGRCLKCNKNTGWFGGERCEEHQVIYGQWKYGLELKITDGFYVGQSGKLLKYIETGIFVADKFHNHLKIRLDDGEIIIVPTCDVEIIE